MFRGAKGLNQNTVQKEGLKVHGKMVQQMNRNRKQSLCGEGARGVAGVTQCVCCV